jgi:hypothetical protein
MVSYKQPCPYNIQAEFPAFFVLYAAVFSWLIAFFRAPINLRSSLAAGLYCFLYSYSFALLYLIHGFALPWPSYFICLLPLVVAAHLMAPQLRNKLQALAIALLTFLGIVMPTYHFTQLLPQLNGHYQKYMLTLADALLQEGGDYVAGVPLFYNRHQPVPGLKHIVLPALNYLYHPSKDMLPVMNLPSLYLTPDTTEQIIASLKKSTVKLYINNERLQSTPPAIQQYLKTQYQHFWGSIYLYAPQVEAGRQRVQLKFTGWYRVEGSVPVVLNHYVLAPGTEIRLVTGEYASVAKAAYRLTWIPAILTENLAKEYQQDAWQQTVE